MPALDPEVEVLLELGHKAGRPPFEAMTPEQTRAAHAASWELLQPPAQEVASMRDDTISGGAGPLRNWATTCTAC